MNPERWWGEEEAGLLMQGGVIRVQHGDVGWLVQVGQVSN